MSLHCLRAGLYVAPAGSKQDLAAGSETSEARLRTAGRTGKLSLRPRNTETVEQGGTRTNGFRLRPGRAALLGEWALLENGIEDEKVSAGDRIGLTPAAAVENSNMHYGQQRKSQLFWCQLCRGFGHYVTLLHDRSPITSVRRREISMESLILAQDERWRRA